MDVAEEEKKSLFSNVITNKQAIKDIYIPLEEQLKKFVSIEESNKKIEKIRSAAYNKGYYEGSLAGKESAKKEIAEKVNNEYAPIVKNIPSEITKVLKILEREVVKLSLAIAKKVIRKEVDNPEYITNLIRHLIQDVSDKSQVTLKLNPEDVVSLREHGVELELAEEVEELNIEEDASVLRGGCILETNLGSLDARLDEQIAEIEKNLNAAVPANNESKNEVADNIVNKLNNKENS